MRYVERYLLLFVRIYFGMFNLVSGLNYFVLFWPQPHVSDPLGNAFVQSALALGIFQMVKVIELTCGALIVCDVFTPLALVVLFPVTFEVFYLDTFISPLLHVKASGARNFLFHLILLAAYGRYLYPLIKVRPEKRPLWRSWRELRAHV